MICDNKLEGRSPVAVSIGFGLLDWNLEHVCLARGRTLFLLKFSLRDDDDEFLYGDSQFKVPVDFAVAPPVPSSAGENTPSPRICILLRRVLYPTRPQTKYKFDIFGSLSFPCVRVSFSFCLSLSLCLSLSVS
jgi:hypothetical protein